MMIASIRHHHKNHQKGCNLLKSSDMLKIRSHLPLNYLYVDPQNHPQKLSEGFISEDFIPNYTPLQINMEPKVHEGLGSNDFPDFKPGGFSGATVDMSVLLGVWKFPISNVTKTR